MNTDRRIYFATAIVAIVVAITISFLAHSGPLASYSRGIALREAQSTAKVEAVGVHAPADWLDFERAPAALEATRVASANPGL